MKKLTVRGISTHEESKGEWKRGYLIEDEGVSYIINSVVEANDEYITIGEWCSVDTETLGISTGLFDKKGVEIFEGDVISTYTDNLVIKRDNLLGFYVELDEKRNYFAETVDIEYLDLFAKDFGVAVEVLGNIYENADLLGEEESDKETVAELIVKGVFDKKNERWYVDTDEATVEAMNSFLKEHDLDVFESWLGYLEGGMNDESLAFINILQTIEDEIELADGSKIKLVEG